MKKTIVFFEILLVLIISLNSKLCFSQDPSSDDKLQEKEIEVVLGIDTILKIDYPFSPKVQIGNPGILKTIIVPQKQEIILQGLKAGKTNVTIRNTIGDIKDKYIVQVTVTNNSKTVQELREFLGDVEGLTIDIKGGKVVVGGEIVVPTEIGRIVTILDKYPDVIRLVQLSPQAKRLIAQKMQEEIQKNGMKQVTVRIVNGVFWIEGVVSSDFELKELLPKIVEGYLPDLLADLSSKSGEIQRIRRSPYVLFVTSNPKQKPPNIPKLIKIISQFVELTKDFGRVFGFKWEPLLSGGGGSISFGKTTSGNVTTQSNDTLTGTISNLFPKLSSARNAGYARIIQSGMVITQDQSEAKLVKNTSTPYAIGTGEFQQAKSADTGLNITVTPTIITDEQIQLTLGVNVTTSAGSVGGNPITTSNGLSTKVVVKSKDSAAIGGVVFNQSRTDYDKPSQQSVGQAQNGQAPPEPLFSFIRGKSYTTNKNQFVVFVTPEILESASTGTNDVRKKFRRRGI